MLHAWPDLFGYLAASLLLLTFSMQQMTALRALAIASSIAWVIYGWADHIYPVFCLHMILLPLNTVRLCQALRAAVPAKAEAAPARFS
ncbi:MAG TPA: hypothetical protein VF007_09690 [Stellaceae bacterium]